MQHLYIDRQKERPTFLGAERDKMHLHSEAPTQREKEIKNKRGIRETERETEIGVRDKQTKRKKDR